MLTLIKWWLIFVGTIWTIGIIAELIWCVVEATAGVQLRLRWEWDKAIPQEFFVNGYLARYFGPYGDAGMWNKQPVGDKYRARLISCGT